MYSVRTNSNTPRRTGLAVLLLCAQSFVVHAGVFKCTDSVGKTSYQSTPCPATASTEKVQVEKAKVEPTAPAETQLVDGEDEVAIDLNSITGVWVEKTEEQSITLTLSATGGYRWKVVFRGKNHSDLSGIWNLDGDTLILRGELLGTDRYKIVRLAEKEMTIHRRSLGTDFTTHFRRLF